MIRRTAFLLWCVCLTLSTGCARTSASRTVYLTFDLCPTREGMHLDKAIINFLLRNKIPATFFISGLWLEDHSAEAETLKSPLFSVGGHGYRHLDFSTHSREDLLRELARTDRLIRSYFGRSTRLFRFPYGLSTSSAERLVAEAGYTTVWWTIESKDPEPEMTALLLREKVRKEISPGGIILMHANGYGFHTADALPGIVSDLKNLGYSFSRLPEDLKPDTPANKQ